MENKFQKKTEVVPQSNLDIAEGMETERLSRPGVVEAFDTLSMQMQDILPKINTILCDDTGARVPSWFFYKLINGIKKNTNTNLANLTYVLGGKSTNYDDGLSLTTERIEYLIKNNELREPVLIVTEYISTGKSMVRLINLLEKHGIKKYSIATISIKDTDHDEVIDDYLSEGILYTGSTGKLGMNTFWRKTDIGGVTKQYYPSLAHSVADRYRQDSVNSARKDMANLAKILSIKYYK